MEENTRKCPNLVLNELSEAMELTRQLEASQEQPRCKRLAQNILTSLQNVFQLIQGRSCDKQGQSSHLNFTADSPPSACPSLHGGSPESALKGILPKKRKGQDKIVKQVSVGAKGFEACLEDGYSWRKYGQKDILGAKHPRAYYRCTRRHSHGCQAMKQVQRSDNDPTVFDVTYYNSHICLQIKSETSEQAARQRQAESALKLKLESVDSAQHQASSSFSFPFTPTSSNPSTSQYFSTHAMQDTCCMGITASEEVYIPPYEMSGYGGGSNLREIETTFSELVTPATSATNSPLINIESAEFNLSLFALDEFDSFRQSY